MPDDLAPCDVEVVTADGLTLEGQLRLPASPRAAALLTHPHPLQGGSMQSIVTSELFRHLPPEAIAALRFNFRGVAGSEGEHGNGVNEALDVAAALDVLSEQVPEVPIFVAGWSFGADVALQVVDPRLAGWFLVAPPLRVVSFEAMVAADDPRPKLLVVPEHDQFRPPDSAREATISWANTTVETVKGADHFLVGRTDKVAQLALEFVGRL